MAFQVTCPNPGCGAVANVEEQSLGKRGRCKKCGHVFALARPDGQPASAMSGDASAWRKGQAPASPASLPEQFGRYRIMKALGQGGMGAVYLAHDSKLNRQVALKVPSFGAHDGPQAVERFEREARAAATLNHPNLCPVHDVGEVDGVPYLTMPYIEGKTLADAIPGSRALPEGQAAAIARKLALALQEAHEKGIIHRDLKPGNIMINRRRELIIMDFGLARISGAEEGAITRVGHVLGTALYMAPEQAAGDLDAIGPAADVYSLGVILHELLTGRRPFEGPWSLVIGLKNVKDPDPPSTHRPGLSPALDAICLKAIAREPVDRYPSMAAFAEGLATFLAGEPGRTSPPEPSGSAVSPKTLFAGLELRGEGSTLAKGSATAPGGGRPRRARRVALGASACLVLGTIIAYRATDNGRIKVVVDDPRAVVKVDGREVRVEGPGEPITLGAGEHTLAVKRGDGEFRTRTFIVRRGSSEVLRAEIPPEGADQAAASRFRPGATWVGTCTFAGAGDSGETWPCALTITKRSGDRFEAEATLVDLGKREVHSSLVGTLRGHRVEGSYRGPTGGEVSIAGPVDGRDFRFRFQGPDGKRTDEAALVYQGPMEPRPGPPPRRGEAGGPANEEGADRLKWIGHWDHRPGDVRRDVELMANGTARMGGWRGTWTLERDRLTLIWPGPHYQGQARVDEVVIQADKAHYVGTNREGPAATLGEAIVGSYVGGGGFEGMPVVDYGLVASPLAPIFNGKDLTGWESQEGQPVTGSVQDGMIVTTEKGRLYTVRDDYRDFHLRAELKVGPDFDGGLFFRSQMRSYTESTYSAAINTTVPPKGVKSGSLLLSTHSPAKVYNVFEARDECVRPDQWFVLEVFAIGNHFTVKIDGRLVAEWVDREATYRAGRIALHRKSTSGEGRLACRKIEVAAAPSGPEPASIRPGEAGR